MTCVIDRRLVGKGREGPYKEVALETSIGKNARWVWELEVSWVSQTNTKEGLESRYSGTRKVLRKRNEEDCLRSRKTRYLSP